MIQYLSHVGHFRLQCHTLLGPISQESSAKTTLHSMHQEIGEDMYEVCVYLDECRAGTTAAGLDIQYESTKN